MDKKQLRDQFAVAALPHAIDYFTPKICSADDFAERIAKLDFDIADAMVEESYKRSKNITESGE